jgi:2-keto-4-pentenoate hydratase/2-oxohepta-3-ene-1,7-dioic acid hydratase in catechol pathway
MKLTTFQIDNRPTWGIVEGDAAFDVGEILGTRFPDLKSLIAAGAISEANAAKNKARSYPAADLAWLPVIPNPDKVLCVGLNYEMHRKETGRAEVGHPTIFTRFANSQTGNLQPIVLPHVSTNLDFEGELAVIIGKRGRYIAREHALSHLAGFSCYNDASIRDWQYHTPQFTPGKNFPSTGAFGPWLVTPDEFGDFADLRIATRLNGQVVQEAVFSQMIFDIPTIIEYCSSFTVLEPGDVIITGTPGGVGARRTPPLWMKPGDVVEVEIDRIGVLRNPIAAE